MSDREESLKALAARICALQTRISSLDTDERAEAQAEIERLRCRYDELVGEINSRN